MDPTTQSHLDSATLNHQPGAVGDVPSLNVQSTADIKASANAGAGKTSTAATGSSEPAATGLRQRVNTLGAQLDQATDHPAVKNAKDVAGKQVNQFREFLGNFPAVRNLEKRFGVDRVVLVVGGIFASVTLSLSRPLKPSTAVPLIYWNRYILLVPLNLFRLALPITQCLTFVPPAMLALEALDRGDSAMDQTHVKLLLSYFVILGLIQFTESLIPGVLERKIRMSSSQPRHSGLTDPRLQPSIGPSSLPSSLT